MVKWDRDKSMLARFTDAGAPQRARNRSELLRLLGVGGEAAVAYAMLTFSYYPVEFCYGSADDEQLEMSSSFEGRVYVQYRGQACSMHLQASCG